MLVQSLCSKESEMAEVYCGIDASPLSATVCVTVRALMKNTEYALQTSQYILSESGLLRLETVTDSANRANI